MRLDLALHPDDAPGLARAPEFSAKGAGSRRRAVGASVIWHDTPEATLEGEGLSLAERRIGRETSFRLERLRPDAAQIWAPGTPPECIAEGDTLEALRHAGLHDGRGHRPLPDGLMPVAGLEGQLRSFVSDGVAVTLLTGQLRAVAGTRPIARVEIDAAPGAALKLARRLAQSLRLCVPSAAIAAEGLAVARAGGPGGRSGPSLLAPSFGVSDAFAAAIAHLSGVILHHARLVAVGTPEPVHQMRVAVRRLRSIAKLFSRAVACPELDAALAELRALGQALGPARDWDVFCAGTARDVASALPDAPALARLAAAAAARKRDAAYADLGAYLASAEFRQLGLSLTEVAATQPWQRAVPAPSPVAEGSAAPAEAAGEPTAGAPDEPPSLRHFASRTLAKRHKKLFAPGRDIADLPAPELHAIRLDGKRMRYAAELFAPLFPGRDGKRYLKRLAALQDRLGHLNDGAVAAGLVEALGQSERFAGGCVRGFVAAGMGGARAEIAAAWRKLRRRDPFWT